MKPNPDETYLLRIFWPVDILTLRGYLHVIQFKDILLQNDIY